MTRRCLHFVHLFAVNSYCRPAAVATGFVKFSVLESLMSAVLGRRRRFLRVWAWTIIFAATLGASAAQADTDTVNVSVDQAVVMKLPQLVATIVIGNPLIADAALQSGAILVITARATAPPT